MAMHEAMAEMPNTLITLKVNSVMLGCSYCH